MAGTAIQRKRGSVRGAPPTVYAGMAPLDGVFEKEFARQAYKFIYWLTGIFVFCMLVSIFVSVTDGSRKVLKPKEIKVPK